MQVSEGKVSEVQCGARASRIGVCGAWSIALYGSVVLRDVRIPAGATVKLQIDKTDELDNWDSLKIDYVLLLGT